MNKLTDHPEFRNHICKNCKTQWTEKVILSSTTTKPNGERQVWCKCGRPGIEIESSKAQEKSKKNIMAVIEEYGVSNLFTQSKAFENITSLGPIEVYEYWHKIRITVTDLFEDPLDIENQVVFDVRLIKGEGKNGDREKDGIEFSRVGYLPRPELSY